MIKDKLLHFIEQTFNKKECKPYLACNDKKHFSLLMTIIENIIFGLVRMYVTPYRFFWIIFILDLELSCTDKLLVPMETNCAPLVADSFLFCYERDFMTYSNDNQVDIIKAFNSTS